jgi:hypothetical protein
VPSHLLNRSEINPGIQKRGDMGAPEVVSTQRLDASGLRPSGYGKTDGTGRHPLVPVYAPTTVDWLEESTVMISPYP